MSLRLSCTWNGLWVSQSMEGFHPFLFLKLRISKLDGSFEISLFTYFNLSKYIFLKSDSL
jgi:hypothetical protein